MKKLLMTIAGILVAAGMAVAGTDYVVTKYGVKRDSMKVQTEAIQRVIDRAEAEGGGRIVIPKGTFFSGALFFKPGTSLHLEEGGCLKGSDEIKDFPLIPSRMEGRCIYYYAALVNAYHVGGFEITGPGTINGNGLKYWKQFWALRKVKPDCTNLEVHRPRLVFLWGCDSVRISGPTLCDSPFWTTHLYQCRHVLIENCRITAPREPVHAPSSDAIDLDVCSDVTVRDCYLNCDDDGVCIKGGKGVHANRSPENGIVENILVERCTFGPNLHGVLTLGSECIHARNIEVHDCKVNTQSAILRLKMRPDTYQIYENITVRNITGSAGSVIDMKPWTQFFTLEGSGEKPYGIVRDILMENIDVKAQSLGTLSGNPGDTVSDFVLRNITVDSSTPSFNCIYPSVILDNVMINGDELTNPAQCPPRYLLNEADDIHNVMFVLTTAHSC